jgi:hypothetical protein
MLRLKFWQFADFSRAGRSESFEAGYSSLLADAGRRQIPEPHLAGSIGNRITGRSIPIQCRVDEWAEFPALQCKQLFAFRQLQRVGAGAKRPDPLQSGRMG